MYEDLDDIVPRQPTVAAAFENPFEDVFSGSRSQSLDPWSTPFGDPNESASGFPVDDWNRNAFADDDENNAINTRQEESVLSPEYEEPSVPSESPVTPTTPAVLITPARNDVTPTVTNVDPLDAALSNVEEPPEHIPVFKRKLPLLSQSTVEASESIPEKTSTSVSANGHDEHETKESPSTEDVAVTPTQQENVVDLTSNPPSPIVPQMPRASKTTTLQPVTSFDQPAPSPASSAFSEDTYHSSRAPSETTAARIVSPLQKPAMLPNPLDRGYNSLGAVGSDIGGWGEGNWGNTSTTTVINEDNASLETPETPLATATEEEDVCLLFDSSYETNPVAAC